MLVLVGTNHKYSPLEIRESISFTRHKLKDGLVRLLGYEGIKAAVILSTCNRVELYANVSNKEKGLNALKVFLSGFHPRCPSKIHEHLYTYTGKEAVRHLFRVVSGVDSQIIGENQVLGQVKFAYEQAKLVEAADKLLDWIFTKAVKVSAKARHNTGISKGKVSIGSIVIELTKTRFPSLDRRNILIIGVGKISELVVKYLKKEKVKTVFVANRTYDKAVELAEKIKAEVVRFDHLKERLKYADIVITATSSAHLILKKDDILEAMNKEPRTKNQGPLLIIDLAVPRDVDPEVKSIQGVELFNLDDLNSIIEKNLDKRKEAIPEAEEIIDREVKNLCLKNRLRSARAPAPLP